MGAMGVPRGQFYRARAEGKIPRPDRPTLGGYARWSVALAASIVRGMGRKVPKAWGVARGGAT